MTYIKPEQFLALDEKVQKVFINWWEPQMFNLFYHDNYKEIRVVEEYDCKELKTVLENGMAEHIIPLLQMHQLVQFIEDKTDCAVDVIKKKIENGFLIRLHNGISLVSETDIVIGDRLQALFQAAAEIAEKEVKK